jgi:hypothetical protein
MKDTKTSSKKKVATKSSARSAPAKSAKSGKVAPAKHASTAAPKKSDASNPEKRKQVAAEGTAVAQAPTVSEPATPPAAPAAKEPVITEQPDLPTTHGKVGVFGGPKDRGIKPDDKLALPTGPHGVYERVRSLNPKGFYCAMRWNYHVQHLTPEEVKRWWANKKLSVSNPKNGNSVVVRAVDYGPHENTGLDIGISPGAAEALGVEVGDEVDIALADPKSPLGPSQ